MDASQTGGLDVQKRDVEPTRVTGGIAIALTVVWVVGLAGSMGLLWYFGRAMRDPLGYFLALSDDNKLWALIIIALPAIASGVFAEAVIRRKRD
jgi:hypothetical protein